MLQRLESGAATHLEKLDTHINHISEETIEMAVYNVHFTIKNETPETLHINHINAAPSATNWNGGDWGRLYHGEMVGQFPNPTVIKPGESANWSAKSTDSTIQGAMNWYINGDEEQDCNMYFHVKSGNAAANGNTASIGKASPIPAMKNIKVTPAVSNDGNHPYITYTVTGQLTP